MGLRFHLSPAPFHTGTRKVGSTDDCIGTTGRSEWLSFEYAELGERGAFALRTTGSTGDSAGCTEADDQNFRF